MKEHTRTHTKEKPHKCNICSNAFSNQSNLRRHERYHQEAKSFRCETCSKSFIIKKELKRHEKIHQIKEVSKENLDKDIKVEEDLEKNKCLLCNTLFSQYELESHHLECQSK